MLPAHRARALANWVNLSTPAGLLVARIGGATVRGGRRGLIVGHGYRLPVPPAPAFTLGNVVLLRRELPAGRDPIGAIPVPLLVHEEGHATQYALFGGVLMPVLYLGAAGWSWLRTGDFFSRNAFERGAGLGSGGYREQPVRPRQESLAAVRRLVAGYAPLSAPVGPPGWTGAARRGRPWPAQHPAWPTGGFLQLRWQRPAGRRSPRPAQG